MFVFYNDENSFPLRDNSVAQQQLSIMVKHFLIEIEHPEEQKNKF